MPVCTISVEVKKPLVAAALPQNTDFILPDVPVRT